MMMAGVDGVVQAGTNHTRRLVSEALVRGDQAAIVRSRPSYHEPIGMDRMPEWLA